MRGSKIEWTWYQLPDGTWVRKYTFNPWIGCQEVSIACLNCYAKEKNTFRKWTADGAWGPHAERRRTVVGYWKQPYTWARRARELGVRPRVFSVSLGDWLDNKV